jgi:hypothetical protein
MRALHWRCSAPRSVASLAAWREHNWRAAGEGVIKDLDAGCELAQLVGQSFWATRAARSFGVLAANLVVFFERKLGWLEAVTLGSLRCWLVVSAGVIRHSQGRCDRLVSRVYGFRPGSVGLRNSVEEPSKSVTMALWRLPETRA